MSSTIIIIILCFVPIATRWVKKQQFHKDALQLNRWVWYSKRNDCALKVAHQWMQLSNRPARYRASSDAIKLLDLITQHTRRRLVGVRFPQLIVTVLVGSLALIYVGLTDQLTMLIGVTISGLTGLLGLAVLFGLQDSQREIEEIVTEMGAWAATYPSETVAEALALAASRFQRRDADTMKYAAIAEAVPVRIIVLWSLAEFVAKSSDGQA